MKKELSEYKNSTIYFLILLIIVILGIIIRLKGLGRWPLTVDEYYIVQSVKNILKTGLPAFTIGGGYYDRGILYQYLTASLFLTGIKVEYAARIIPLITNIITIIPIYLLMKKISGKFAAAVLVFIFCFSVWEVEFARFGRMYSPFQMIFIFYLYNLYNTLVEGNRKSLKWLLILSFTSIFVYEGSVFLCILNFLPGLWNSKKKKIELTGIFNRKTNISYLVLSFLTFLLMYIYLRTDFRMMGTSLASLLPPGFLKINGDDLRESMFRLPKLLISTLYHYKIFIFLFAFPLIISGFAVFRISKLNELYLAGKVVFIIAIILSVLNLFGLAIVFLVMFFLIDRIKKKELKDIYKLVLIPFIINFIFWTIFALKTNSWHSFYPQIHFASSIETLKILWKGFINYPYFYETFVLFRDAIPKYTFVLVFLMLLETAYFLINKNENDYKVRLFFAIFILLLVLVDILNLTYFQTRYFFFLYPLFLILAVASLEKILSRMIKNLQLKIITLSIIIILLLSVSEDFNLNHLINIDSQNINYRIGMNYELKEHYYPRWDVRTPAEIINKNKKPADIVITNEQINDFYLDKLDYIYRDYRRSDFVGESVDHGKKERWTGANLIYDDKDLINLLKHKNDTKWVIINTLWFTRYLKEDGFFTEFKKYMVYSNSDSSAYVYKIPPAQVLSNVN